MVFGLQKILDANPPQIIILDINMDGISGTDICLSLKGNEGTSYIPVIMVSATHNVEEVAKKCGADDYLSKPFNIIVMKEKLNRLLTVSTIMEYWKNVLHQTTFKVTA